MFGCDIITLDNFIMGGVFGMQNVTGEEVDSVMIAYSFYLHYYPGKPFAFDLSYTKAYLDNIYTKEFKARLGFIFGGNNLYDFGIGYSWLKLNTNQARNSINFSVRFWM